MEKANYREHRIENVQKYKAAKLLKQQRSICVCIHRHLFMTHIFKCTFFYSAYTGGMVFFSLTHSIATFLSVYHTAPRCDALFPRLHSHLARAQILYCGNMCTQRLSFTNILLIFIQCKLHSRERSVYESDWNKALLYSSSKDWAFHFSRSFYLFLVLVNWCCLAFFLLFRILCMSDE